MAQYRRAVCFALLTLLCVAEATARTGATCPTCNNKTGGVAEAVRAHHPPTTLLRSMPSQQAAGDVQVVLAASSTGPLEGATVSGVMLFFGTNKWDKDQAPNNVPATGFGNSQVSPPNNIPVRDNWTEFAWVNGQNSVKANVETSGLITLTYVTAAISPINYTLTSSAFVQANGQFTVIQDDFNAKLGLTLEVSLTNDTLSIDVPGFSGSTLVTLDYIIQLDIPQCNEGVCCGNNAFAPNTTSCRDASACSAETFCSGHSADCPAEQFAPRTQSCRPASACSGEAFCMGDSADCPEVQFAPSTQSCRPASACSAEAFCSGASADCPSSTRPNGAYFPWRPSPPRPRGYYSAAPQAADNSAEAVQLPDITVPASAAQAAAWITGQLSYDVRWPECEGKCIKGYCALEWDHPACCFVPRRHMSDLGSTSAAPKDTPDSDHVAAIARSGYWKSRDFYCWR